jgi:hypothetical protein
MININNRYKLMEKIDIVEELIVDFKNKCIIITPAEEQTKDWRKKQSWYDGGKHNECEIYQRNLIEQIIKTKLHKTNDRIYMKNMMIISKRDPMKDIDGFEWTEDFDGLINISDKKVYFNLKFVCDAGGSQTRTIREVYHFIKRMLHHLIIFKKTDLYFMNILDGDTCYKSMDKFNYLLNKKKYKDVKKYVYIGDLHNFYGYSKIFDF